MILVQTLQGKLHSQDTYSSKKLQMSAIPERATIRTTIISGFYLAATRELVVVITAIIILDFYQDKVLMTNTSFMLIQMHHDEK